MRRVRMMIGRWLIMTDLRLEEGRSDGTEENDDVEKMQKVD